MIRAGLCAKLRKSVFGACSLAAIAVATPGVAFAQAQEPEAQSENEGLDEIVVTAEKHETNVQKTPISIAVVDNETLERNNVGNLADVIKILPSVSYGRNFANSIVGIRGVSSRDTDETGDPAVAVSVDGTYFNRTLGINEVAFDLERVEALRGPQGTLYGRSATGGALNFITAKPGKEFSAYVGGGVGSYSALNTEGMLNVPLADWLQVRAAFETRYHAGFRNNGPAKDGDDADTKAGRISLAFQPTSALSGVLTVEKVRSDGIGGVNYGQPLKFDGTGAVIHERPAFPSDGKTWALGFPDQYVQIDTTSVRGKLTYDFGGVELLYQGGFRRLDFDAQLNLSGQSGHPGLFGTDAYFAPQLEKISTWNHELRLSSQGNSVLDYQFGLYYFKESNDLLSNFSYFDNGNQNPRIAFQFRYPDMGTESKAAFGQVGVHIGDKLTLEGGLRFTHDKKWRFGYADYRAFSAFLPIHQLADWDKLTYHVGANFEVSPTSLFYAKIDTGYKPGGYTDVAPYGPENIKAYEIGTKNRFLDNKLQLNASAYYYDYSDQQVLQFVGSQSIIRNAGKAEYYGVELQAVALVTPQDKLNVDLAYSHAEYKVFAIADATANLNLAGNTPPQAPRFSGNAGYEHDFDVLGGTLTFRAQSHFETKTFLQFYNYNSDRQGSYTRSDIILTYKAPDDRWLVEGFVRNIEDKLVITAGQEQSLLQSYVYQFAEPRTYGARFRVNW